MKKSKLVLAIVVGAAATAFALPAAAQVYVGAGAGQSKTKDFCQGTAMVCGDRKLAWRGFGGYRISNNFAVEGGYHYLGKFTADTRGFFVGASEAAGLLHWPLTSDFSFYGRLGVYHARTKSAPFSKINNGWTYGFGAELDATKNVSLRTELQRYDKVGGGDIGIKADIDVFGLAIVLKFR